MVDVIWGDERTKSFVTNVGLVTSNGRLGHDVMSAEWTHMLSYSPFMVSVSIRKGKTSHENISKSKQFGVSIASDKQDVLASVAGSYSGKDVDKISLLKELGFDFYKGKKINALLVKGASMNAEFKLVKKIEAGSHTLFIGECVELTALPIEPLAYHKGQFWELDKNVPKPNDAKRHEIKLLAEKHKRK